MDGTKDTSRSSQTELARIRADLAEILDRAAQLARQVEQLHPAAATAAAPASRAAAASHRRPRPHPHLRVVKLILIGGAAAGLTRRLAAILMTAGTATIATAAVTMPLIIRAPAITDGPGAPPAIPAAPSARHHSRRMLRPAPRRSIPAAAPAPAAPSASPSASPLAAGLPVPSATPAPSPSPSTYSPPAQQPQRCIILVLARICLPLQATQ